MHYRKVDRWDRQRGCACARARGGQQFPSDNTGSSITDASSTHVVPVVGVRQTEGRCSQGWKEGSAGLGMAALAICLHAMHLISTEGVPGVLELRQPHTPCQTSAIYQCCREKTTFAAVSRHTCGIIRICMQSIPVLMSMPGKNDNSKIILAVINLILTTKVCICCGRNP